MKSTLILVIILFLGSCTSNNQGSSEADIAAIKTAIENETLSFYQVDRPAWEASWVQANHAYWSYSDSTGTSYLEGWEKISKNFIGYFETQIANRNIDVARSVNDLTIDRDWQEVRVYGDGAYVRYTQRVKDNQIDRDETSQIRVMEKKDGVWKVAYVGIIAKYD